tara:strand:+ start:2301 stop:2612 length:312 start_codon:yes stop_codon:yes gene_type:complete
MNTEQFNGGTDQLWSAEDLGDEIYIWGEDDEVLYVVSPGPSRKEVDYEVMQADGRLMAAAPLLLALLRRLLDAIYWDDLSDDDDPLPLEIDALVARRIREKIE